MATDLIQSTESVEFFLTWPRKSVFLTLFFITAHAQRHIGRCMYPAFWTFKRLIVIKQL